MATTLNSPGILREAERRQVLFDWNNTLTDYPRHQCIHQLFEQQVEQRPEAIALKFREQQMTYRQLNERANQVAHRLRELGVGPDVMVGTLLERSLEMVVGLLAILKAGGAFVPLDATYPRDRAGIGGAVVLLLVVDRDGKPQELKVVQSVGKDFDDHALAAVGRWKFRPGTCDGEPIPMEISVEIDFHPRY